MALTDDQIKYMVDRFLCWKLPRDTFNPDCGISFNKGPINAHTDYPSLHEPTGTNLFDAGQADAMIRYMVEGMPEGLFFHSTPKPDACDHDFSGWRNFPDGNGGEQVCKKCGMGAMAATLATGF